MKMMNLHSGRIKVLIVLTLMLAVFASAFGESSDDWHDWYDDAVEIDTKVTTMGIYTVSVKGANNDYKITFSVKGKKGTIASYNGKYQYWEYRRGFDGYEMWETPAFDMSQIDLTKIITKVDPRITLERTGLDSSKLSPLSSYVDIAVCYDDKAVVNTSIKTMGIYNVAVKDANSDYKITFSVKGKKGTIASYNGKYQYWEYRRGFDGYEMWETPAFDMSQVDLTKFYTKVDSRITLDRTFPEGVEKLTALSTARGGVTVKPTTTTTTTSSTTTAQKDTTTTTTKPATTTTTTTTTSGTTTAQKDTTTTTTKPTTTTTSGTTTAQKDTTTTTTKPTTTTNTTTQSTKPARPVILDTPDESGGWYDDAAEWDTSITKMGPYTISYNISKGRYALVMISYPGDSAYIGCYDLMYQYWHYRRGYSGYQTAFDPYFDMSQWDTSKFFKKVDSRITLDREVKKGETSLKPLSEKDAAAILNDIVINGKTYEKTGFASVAGVTITGSGKDGVFIKGRTVTLSPYIIGKYEVTQELFEAVVKDSPSSFKKDSLTAGEKQELRPVERVSFLEVAEFCNKLSELQGLQPAFVIKGDDVTVDLTKNGWRVPTEAEWECAARGGNPSDTAWSNLFGGGKDAKDGLNYAWVKDNSNNVTHEVGLKKPNSLGLYDTLGNVLEWCADWYTGIKSGTVSNPSGLSIGTDRSCRGGSKNATDTISVLTRANEPPAKYYSNLGFRLCRTNTGSTASSKPVASMSTKPLSLTDFSLYDGIPDYGVRGGGYAKLSDDIFTVYIPVSLQDKTEYWVEMKLADNNVAKIKSANMLGEGEDDPDWGQVTFYNWEGSPDAYASMGWKIKDGDKFEVVYKDDSVKRITTKVKYVPALYTEPGYLFTGGYRPCIRFQYKDVDAGYELKLSDIVFETNECGAEFDELMKDPLPYYADDPNGQGYYVYLKSIKKTGDVSINVMRNGEKAAITRSPATVAFDENAVDFSDIVINGKTYSKTSFAEIESDYLYGSGDEGVFTEGRTVAFSNSYMIGKYPVTQELYEAVVSLIPGAKYPNPSSGKSDSCTSGEKQVLRPVERVDYVEVATFCNKLSELQGLEPVFTIKGDSVTFDITKNGWRIPTEAEWEYAARGGDSENYAVWNNLYAGAKDANDALNYAWVKANSNNVTHEVGLKKPNAIGLYDMLGNVYEWCLDWYGSINREYVTDPVGPSTGTKRVQRSCSKGSSSVLPVTVRDSDLPSKYYSDLGFRLCRTLK